LELGLSLALANVSDSAVSDGNVVSGLAAWINQNADIYVAHNKLAEAIATLRKINEVKDTQGDNPAMRRALAAQEHSIESLFSQISPRPEPSQQAGGSRLQITKTTAERASDLLSIQKQNRDWLQTYDQKLNELTRLAAASESFTHA
jgi:hypothetical protein